MSIRTIRIKLRGVRVLGMAPIVGALALVFLPPGNTGGLNGIRAIGQDTSQTQRTAQLPPLPAVEYPADKPEVLAAMYTFAAAHPEVLSYVPCYCSCGKNFGHRSNEDCFIKARSAGSVVWCEHGAECVMCLQLAERAQTLYLAGHSVNAIRKRIDKEFGSKFKNATPTPYPRSGGPKDR